MMQNGDLYGRLENQADLFSKGHVEHGSQKELWEYKGSKRTEHST